MADDMLQLPLGLELVQPAVSTLNSIGELRWRLSPDSCSWETEQHL